MQKIIAHLYALPDSPGSDSTQMMIPSQQTFGTTIQADAVLAGITTATRVWVMLEGVNGRETM